MEISALASSLASREKSRKVYFCFFFRNTVSKSRKLTWESLVVQTRTSSLRQFPVRMANCVVLDVEEPSWTCTVYSPPTGGINLTEYEAAGRVAPPIHRLVGCIQSVCLRNTNVCGSHVEANLGSRGH
jgi:hypothetical protein